MELKECARGVFAALGEDGTANAGFIVGDGRVLVVDTMMLPYQGRELRAAIDREAPGTTITVVNTHHHGDHVIGNMLFPDSIIISHSSTRDRFAQAAPNIVERYCQLRPQYAADFRQVEFVLPNLCFCRSLTLHLGRRRVELFHPGPAHTEGDVAVYLPAERMLFAGDLLFSRVFPAVLPEADTRGWIRTLAELEQMPVDTVVPGHGPLGAVEQLRSQRAYLEHVREAVGPLIARGVGKDETIQTVPKGPADGLEQPERHAWCVGQVYEELKAGR